MTTYWTLNDAYGTVRDLVKFDGTRSKIDYDEHGTPTRSDSSAPHEAIWFRGRMFVQELGGYFGDGAWTSALLGNRALSSTVSGGAHSYAGIITLSHYEQEQFGFWSEFGRQVVGRIDNAIQVGFGIAEIGAGALFFIPTGGLSGLAVLNGIDNVVNGWNDTPTWTNQLAQGAATSLGASQDAAWWIGLGADVAAGFGAGAATAHGARIVAKEAARQALRSHVKAQLAASAAVRQSSKIGEHFRRIALRENVLNRIGASAAARKSSTIGKHLLREKVQGAVAANQAAMRSSKFDEFLLRSERAVAPTTTTTTPSVGSGFSNPTFGQRTHNRFVDALTEQTGTSPRDWLLRTAPGQNGVDATFIGDASLSPGFLHAELKPYSSYSYNQFLNQYGGWKLSDGPTQLFYYNKSGVIGSSGYNFLYDAAGNGTIIAKPIIL